MQAKRDIRFLIDNFNGLTQKRRYGRQLSASALF